VDNNLKTSTTQDAGCRRLFPGMEVAYLKTQKDATYPTSCQANGQLEVKRSNSFTTISANKSAENVEMSYTPFTR